MDSMPSITTNQANIHQNLDCVFPEDPYNTKLNLEAYLERQKVFYLTELKEQATTMFMGIEEQSTTADEEDSTELREDQGW